MNTITMKLQADHLIEEALREDISSEDVTTNSVMKKAVQGEVNLICKQVLLQDWKYLNEYSNCWMLIQRLNFIKKMATQ